MLTRQLPFCRSAHFPPKGSEGGGVLVPPLGFDGNFDGRRLHRVVKGQAAGGFLVVIARNCGVVLAGNLLVRPSLV